MVSSNFQEIFNWEKAIKNKNKNQTNAFCLPFIGFFTQSSQYQIWKANTYSILTNGTNRTWTASVNPQLGSQSFMIPLIRDTNFIKRESKIGYPKVSNWNPPDWKPTYSHIVITTALSSTSRSGILAEARNTMHLICIEQ